METIRIISNNPDQFAEILILFGAGIIIYVFIWILGNLSRKKELDYYRQQLDLMYEKRNQTSHSSELATPDPSYEELKSKIEYAINHVPKENRLKVIGGTVLLLLIIWYLVV